MCQVRACIGGGGFTFCRSLTAHHTLKRVSHGSDTFYVDEKRFVIKYSAAGSYFMSLIKMDQFNFVKCKTADHPAECERDHVCLSFILGLPSSRKNLEDINWKKLLLWHLYLPFSWKIFIMNGIRTTFKQKTGGVVHMVGIIVYWWWDGRQDEGLLQDRLAYSCQWAC